MPEIDVTLPDNSVMTINAPEGASDSDVLAYAKQQWDKIVAYENSKPKRESRKDWVESGDLPDKFPGKKEQARLRGAALPSPMKGFLDVMQGPTLGFMDELVGAGKAVTGLFGDKSIAENYREGRDIVRGANESYEKEMSPWARYPTQIAASLPLLAASKAKQATTFLPKLWQGTKLGAGYGLASGFGGSKGDIVESPDKVAEDTVFSGMMGGVLGLGSTALLNTVPNAATWLYDAAKGRLPYINAGNIARDVFGPAKDKALQILQSATGNKNVGQVIAEQGGVGRDEILALAKVAQSKGNPNQINAMKSAQEEAKRRLLAKVAGAETQEGSIAAQKAAKDALNAEIDPLRVSGSEAANKVTQTYEFLKRQTSGLRDAAAKSVEDVRRFTGAGQRATERANTTYPNPWMPRTAGKFTYIGELAEKADDVATKSASDSLLLGDAARFAEMKLGSLEAHGLSRLNSEPLFAKINALATARGDRANPVITGTLEKFKRYLVDNKLIDKNGNIDAYDLHGIRKNLNSIVDSLYPNADKPLKDRAASVLAQLKPTIDEGLKKAGGHDLIKYFDAFSRGMHRINKMKLGAEAQKLTDDNLVSLVKGDKPELIESVFGPGKFSFSGEMGRTAKPLKEAARRIEADKLIESRGGSDAAMHSLGDILERDMIGFRFPAYLDVKAATANKALSYFENMLNQKTRNVLMEGMQSPRKMVGLLNTLSTAEKNAAMKVINDPVFLRAIGISSGVGPGMLSGEDQ